ncbi:DUF4440 domain-containing protein [Emticicia sp. CRIBPO]|uniref:nuclear transport factor 2 family protein n=1 Tax=Emticicia sp. CRIBPO TaxID=2683258 RepID=UPI001411BD9A|nr:nuclear transport factor 2 family protein [Emticicia sp. CRIBPO]NBA84706.1 DUF4440 domain-containing protein [Emticicia sp. CRIBPO]
MKPFLLFTLLFSFFNLTAQKKHLAEKEKAEHSAVEFFEGLSDSDFQKIKKYSTSDIKIIENGQVWNLDTLARFTSVKRPDDYKRVNTLQFIETVVKGKIAWTSYYNQAEIFSKGKTSVRKWMESIVFVKEDGLWKIRLMHSTPHK